MQKYTPEMKLAEESNIYRDILLLRMRDLSDLYSALLSKYAKFTTDEDLFNSVLSEMVVISSHLIAKLQGGGDNAKEILHQFDEFLPWLDDISIPKRDIDETKKIHKLFRLILKAYDLLGLSNY